ncbi:MAG: mechanosensitive ion channel family protein [Patescibacteria group bacterium]
MHEVLLRYGIDKQFVIDTLWTFIPNVLSALSVVFFTVVFYFITARIFEAALKRTPMQPSLIKITVRSLYRGIVVIIALIFILSELGVNVTAALAGVGVIGLAIGFAAQQTIANIFSGFGIFIDDLYRKGHWIKIGDHYGEVMDISLRTTKIRTLDRTCISVPNATVSTSPVINFSEQGILRISTVVRIPYTESVEYTRKALLLALKKMKGVLKDPAPHVVVKQLADSGVDLYVRVFVDEPGYEQKYYYALTELCKTVLDEAKIKIPFPQQDIHIIKKKPKKRRVVKKKV